MDTASTAPATATARNRAGTISVRTTDEGLPMELQIDPRELRYGAARLAEEIVALNRRAALEAAALRRDTLAAQGVPGDVLDRIGLPTRADVARSQQQQDETQPPVSWLRPV
ncbi:hypothetical protein [Rhodococcus chondri]|uniref:Uncharacterized protein n=1 Tax=Rhodococcus chondri TaxID=3065941 RepID=A0ABU7K0N8_9NOCA|nr:hypothetical protein [Rhodococcus sp. CC-R104]MEE2035384.1 hypothetical protein [Rhodococcus sp. CC-R104]